MAVSERTLSEFLQHSGRVLPDVAEGEMLLHRRDREDLVLMTRGQNEALRTLLQTYLGQRVQTALRDRQRFRRLPERSNTRGIVIKDAPGDQRPAATIKPEGGTDDYGLHAFAHQ